MNNHTSLRKRLPSLLLPVIIILGYVLSYLLKSWFSEPVAQGIGFFIASLTYPILARLEMTFKQWVLWIGIMGLIDFLVVSILLYFMRA